MDNWIQSAIKKPGSFKKYCGGKVTQKCIQKGLKSKNPLTRKRAGLAKALLSMHKSKK